jgi:hypothetical protein
MFGPESFGEHVENTVEENPALDCFTSKKRAREATDLRSWLVDSPGLRQTAAHWSDAFDAARREGVHFATVSTKALLAESARIVWLVKDGCARVRNV